MTEIVAEDTGSVYRIRCTGHASGSPAACAGVSALLYALAGYLENHAVEYYVRLEDGNGEISAPVFEWGAQAAFKMAEIGLAQIAKKYPAAVEMRVYGRNGLPLMI